jgi:hypothetical protein
MDALRCDRVAPAIISQPEGVARLLLLTDGMRRPVSDGMLYAPKLSTRFEAQEIKETGNEEG